MKTTRYQNLPGVKPFVGPEETIMRSSTSCIRWGFSSVILVSLVSFASSPAAGQGGDASIIGQVTDQSGAVLPGVTVTATSPALQVPQVTDVTNERGRVPPGAVADWGL